MNIKLKQARYDLARQFVGRTLEGRRDYIRKMVENGTAHIERHGTSRMACRIFGRTATSTSGHIDWAPAFAVNNWIKTSLEKDAPEESA